MMQLKNEDIWKYIMYIQPYFYVFKNYYLFSHLPPATI